MGAFSVLGADAHSFPVVVSTGKAERPHGPQTAHDVDNSRHLHRVPHLCQRQLPLDAFPSQVYRRRHRRKQARTTSPTDFAPPTRFQLQHPHTRLRIARSLLAQAYISDITPRGPERATAFAFQAAAGSVGFIVGPVLGGVLAGQYGLQAPAYLAAALAFLNLLGVFFLLPESLPKEERQRLYAEAQAVEAAAPLRGRFSLPRLPPAIMKTKVQTLLLIKIAWALPYTALTSVLTLVMAMKFGMNPKETGTFLVRVSQDETLITDPNKMHTIEPCTLFGGLFEPVSKHLVTSVRYVLVTSVSLAFVTTLRASVRKLPLVVPALLPMQAFVGLLQIGAQAFLIKPLVKAFRENALLLTSLGVGALGLVGWAYAPSVLVTAAIMFPIGIASGVFQTVAQAAMSRAAGQGDVGAVLGIGSALESACRVVGPIASGALLSSMGPHGPGVVGAVVAAAGWVLSFARMRDDDEDDAREEAAAAATAAGALGGGGEDGAPAVAAATS